MSTYEYGTPILQDTDFVTINSTGQVQTTGTNFGSSLNFIAGTNFYLGSYDQWYAYIGRLMLTRYWLHLADLGQISETGVVNQSDPNDPRSAINNIFVNEALYYNYIAYLQLLMNGSPFDETPFAPLQTVDTNFLQNYNCQKRQLKSPLSLIISVIAADYAFIVGGYSLIIWIAGTIQKRRVNGEVTSERR